MSGDRRVPRPPPSTGRLRRALLALLAVDAAAAWVVILGVYTFLERAWRGLGERFPVTAPIETHLAQLQAARRVQGLAWVATAVVFLLWLHRAHARRAAAGRHRLQFTPRSAVNAFLVPLANLVLPLRVMAELWPGTDPDRAAGEGGRAAAVPPVVAWWWGLFVTATVADPPWRPLLGRVEDVAIGRSTLVLVAGQLALIASAVLAIVVVRAVDPRPPAPPAPEPEP